MNTKKAVDEIPFSLLYLIMQNVKLEKQIRCYGTDTKIHNSEIHMISAVAKNQDIIVKGLADFFWDYKRICFWNPYKAWKKRAYNKKADVNNVKSLKIAFTTKGKLMHEEHMKYHEEINKLVWSELTLLTEEQIKLLNTFKKNIANKFDSLKL